jgi:hypothetical protein
MPLREFPYQANQTPSRYCTASKSRSKKPITEERRKDTELHASFREKVDQLVQKHKTSPELLFELPKLFKKHRRLSEKGKAQVPLHE